MSKLARKNIVLRIAGETGLSRVQVEDLFRRFLDGIADEVRASGECSLVNFGSFTAKRRPARKGRNPRTGESLMCKPSQRVAFRPSRVLRDYVFGDAATGSPASEE